MEFSFDLQMFGGKGGSTTNVQSYEPSEYELELQKAQADYANAIAPNALWLNNVARGVLEDSLGTVQVDFDELNRQAQDRIYNYTDDMYDSIGDNSRQLRSTNNVLDAISRQVPGVTNDYVNSTNGIIRSNAAASDAINNALGNISSAYGRAANNANGNLGDIANAYGASTSDINRLLGDIAGQYMPNANAYNRQYDRLVGVGDDALGDTNAQLSRLVGKSSDDLDRYGDVRDALIRGEIPSPYLQNMQDAIAGTMKRTAGQGLNQLANRGILNSSVTEGVLNDIEKNASDSVAARYLENINTINNLLGSQSGDTLNSLAQQANIIGQQFGNTGATLDRDANLYRTQQGNIDNALGRQESSAQQRLTNATNALGQRSNLAQQQFGNNTTALGQQGNLAQQQLGNIANANQQNANLLNQQYQSKMTGLNTQAGMANQAFQNQLGAQKQNAATLDSLLGHANDNITTAAAAQEASQQPAANLWNMSMGLNGQTTGALAAASGKGTTTSTTTQSGGGGLFSGLLGGLF